MQVFSERIARACDAAARWHDGQIRKHPTSRIPYITHPATVGMLLAKAGYGEDVVIAGVLHDVIEDCGVSREELAELMGGRVADLVSWVSEDKAIKSWTDRKAGYLHHLDDAPEDALAIVAADHLSNCFSMLEAARDGVDIWQMFQASREEKLAQERAVHALLARRLTSPLVQDLAATLERVAAL